VSENIILIVGSSEHVTESSHLALSIFTVALISRSHLMSGPTAARVWQRIKGGGLPLNSQLEIGYVTRQGLSLPPLHLCSVYEARFQLLFAGKKKSVKHEQQLPLGWSGLILDACLTLSTRGSDVDVGVDAGDKSPKHFGCSLKFIHADY